jgi:hypothetical protein
LPLLRLLICIFRLKDLLSWRTYLANVLGYRFHVHSAIDGTIL